MGKGTFTGSQRLVLVLVGGGILLMSGVMVCGQVGVAIACGAWPTRGGDAPTYLLGPLSYLMGVPLKRVLGSVPGCVPSPAWPLSTVVIGFMLVIVVVVMVLVRVERFQLSPAALRRTLLKRTEVIAGSGEVKATQGEAVTVDKGRRVRPSTKMVRSALPQQSAWFLGTSHGVKVWMSMEDPVLLIGPPRSGKGFGILTSLIAEAPGPVVTTSTRGDNMEATILARAKTGPVYVFDPECVLGRASTMRWSPIHGCEDGTVAKDRATALVMGTGLGGGDSANNMEFATKAIEILQALLHAAAVGGVSLSTLYLWTKNPDRAVQAVEILRTRSSFGWEDLLEATINLPVDKRQNVWFGVSSALTPVDVPDVRELFDPPACEQFDAEEFLKASGTLYLIGKPVSKKAGPGAGVLLGMILDDIVQAAHTLAMRSPEGRLDPPLALVLDEIANVYPWPNLPAVCSAGSGEGVDTVVVGQSLSQFRAKWGVEEAGEIWESCTRKLILGSGSSKKDLEECVALVGERRERQVRSSWGNRDESFSDDESYRPGITVDELRRLPKGMVLLVAGRARAMAVDLTAWTQRPIATLVQQSKAWHQAHPGRAGRSGPLGEVVPVEGVDDVTAA
ncbi:type IV secretory system conjugative DNA transfer family protein [Devriesea agamarum]|uniref:type IV secretory system conjugative DNA transfer family protein n=1 Tax=Devriesea agamarum TaxID=472569 RepID=UPI00071D1471|nr:TraM recognition domain-containing protein [Devriesea agamarum]